MKSLLYISTARSILDLSQIEDLLCKSRAANAMVGLTGLLVVGGRRFLQVLEGPDEAVIETYERIRQDPRHFALVKLREKAVETREFGSWSMGFEQGGEAATSASLSDQVNAMASSITDPTLRAYFAGFAETHARKQLNERV
ncbi:Sensors of blue-light using FAD [Sphingobium sp. AP50]|uniref:BLUF domain-containing protein n=1 Tax=Sphingobium sp. AP50 TaxID=1884369 RepID=UPI0008BD5108|nr:BLUF domain-containing protein [Sphingobium sp. AP50]SEJ96100.1 Sensors of blue-light using FAD [Sphingobium sp. AP50]